MIGLHGPCGSSPPFIIGCRPIMATSSPSLAELSKEIEETSAVIEKCLKDNNLPALCLSKDGPYDFPTATPEIQATRSRLRTASKLIHDLAVGPAEHMRWYSWHTHDFTSLQYINTFKIADYVPKDGSISFEDLGKTAGVDVGV